MLLGLPLVFSALLCGASPLPPGFFVLDPSRWNGTDGLRDDYRWGVENVPFVDVPEMPDLQAAYYYRWRMYKMHIDETPNGFVVTEFLPKVGQSGQYNTISAAAGHHIAEGRWIHDPAPLDNYTTWWSRGGEPRKYTSWIAWAAWQRHMVVGDDAFAASLLPGLLESFRGWSAEHKKDYGGRVCWHQDALHDAMEVSISGDGCRPTLNSVMYGEAVALLQMAQLAGNDSVVAELEEVKDLARDVVLNQLWNPSIDSFAVIPLPADPSLLHMAKPDTLLSPRRLQAEDPCAFDGIAHDFDGSDLGRTTVSGSTDKEKDASCCASCKANAACEFWVRATDSASCWLKSTFAGFKEAQNRRGNFVKSVSNCSSDGELHDFQGANVDRTTYSGNTEEEKDASCCASCQRNPSCEFWVRSTDSSTCWLKRGFAGFADSTVRRGNIFRAPSTICPLGPSPPAAHGRWPGVAWTANETVSVRELLAFMPWYFSLPTAEDGQLIPKDDVQKYEPMWRQLFDSEGFAAEWGLRSAERRSPCYNFSYSHHDCWNGPSWPYETARVLTSAASLLNDYPGQSSLDKADFFTLLDQYARQHTKTTAARDTADPSGSGHVFEVLHPDHGYWINREAGSTQGDDYNHSTFIDLVLIGLLGLRPRPDSIVILNPLVPLGLLTHFAADHILYHRRYLSIVWDVDGSHYDFGQGLKLMVDGVMVASSSTLEQLTYDLGATII